MGIIEPVLEAEEIQGNILAGFNKDFQHFLFFEITQPRLAKGWIRYIQPQISSLKEVVSFNHLYQTMWARQGTEPDGLIVTWMNIAVSFSSLQKIISPEQLNDFGKTSAYVKGLKARSGLLGDPKDPTAEGHTNNWVLGGGANNPDLCLIIASDCQNQLQKKISTIKSSVDKVPGSDDAAGLKLVFEQEGKTRFDLPGHEHFGFKDGISQPGVRGKLSDAPDDYLTKRFIDSSDSRSQTEAVPGQKLVWPGEFVFGYPKQRDDDPIAPKHIEDVDFPNKLSVPVWAKNGSFLVIRRLRQDVEGFWKFIINEGPKIGISDQFLFGAKLVGRWPSGAPIVRSPVRDNPKLSEDDLANNNFKFENDTALPKIRPEIKYKGDEFQQAKADKFGEVCPVSAHIRKVNPRDVDTDRPANANLTRSIIRRGIPFGEPLNIDLTPPPYNDPHNGDRGLMFVSYQTSIEEQFEFISRHWANSIILPEKGGEDPIIGQKNNPRTRSVEVNGHQVKLMNDFVITTGGEYYFQPSITALKSILSV
ncbi:Dyp-type peroxidase [Bacillus altitudinis]|uniref:Dyp-type peroxidase n=1 Tax=Bacillus altitudinis TaxID=293387 RepID=UPI0013C9CCD3|nr:Dyp-type peroxidase [Bacillus altitudinis]MCY7452844.1 Dyp-type peroxidase [Bacillus altitudinis]MDX2363589.1 Dyp-type peroxidase [Bacillus altitudinis]NEU54939.1 Dyp-type peroxidase [Bacillus altitudinis]WHY06593.1 Dyp-type peroxidase [Bacillus altitudinis]WRO27168.1 Dyp-type peroxidase [Bacillus altitudinis]